MMSGMSVDPGLCGDCRHARTVRGARSVFWICGRSATDPEYPRYPALPVRQCPGYETLTEESSVENPSRDRA